MPDDLKIQVTTPGAAEAKRQLEGVAAAETKVGAAGKDAGEKTRGASKDIGKMKDAVSSLGGAVGVSTGLFRSWHAATAVVIGAAVAGLKQWLDRVRELNQELRQGYREFVNLTQQAGTVQLAQIRGETEAQTAKWMQQQAGHYAIAPEEARAAAFALESGMGQQLGRAVQPAAFQVMRAYGVSGQAAAGLAIAAQEAGIARRPEEFKAFYAKAAKYAEGSRVSLQQVADIAGRLLPMAVAAGIDPDYFLAMVGAMSYRISDPSRLATSVERLIRAAGEKGPALAAYGKAAGRPVADLGATEIMEFQSRFVGEAMRRGGPQAAAAAAERLGISAETATVYGTGFDPTVVARLRESMAGARGAGWAGVASRYETIRRRPETVEAATRTQAQTQKMIAGMDSAAIMAIAENLATAYYVKMTGKGADIPGLWESLRSRESVIEDLTGRQIGAWLGEAVQEGLIPEGSDWSAGKWILYGGSSARQRRSAAGRLAQVYQGGTHYHIDDRTDPAGRARAPIGQ